MPGRVEIDPEALARLDLVLACAESQHLCFRSIEVRYVEVEVHLLGLLGAGPARRDMVGCELERECDAAHHAQLHQSSSARSISVPITPP